MMSAIKKILSSGLNIKIASTVLVSIVLIEIIVLVPSFFGEHNKKIGIAENQAKALISTLESVLNYGDNAKSPDFYSRLLFGSDDAVKGYSICNNASCYINFGEMVNTSNMDAKSLLSKDESRLETTQQIIGGENPHWIVLRTDTSHLKGELFIYFLNAFIIICLICVFVSLTTTAGLVWIVIRPVQTLKHNIQSLLSDPKNPLKYMQKVKTHDEIGDLTKTFNRLLFDINNYQESVDKAQKEVEKGLSASEARWKFALEGSGDGVWDWNPSTDKVFFSKQFLNFIGYEENEFITEMNSWAQHLHPKEASASNAAMIEHLNGETEFYSFEQRIKHKQGHWVWSLSRGMVISRNENGVATRVVGTHTDISSHKEAESLIWRQANIDLLTGLPNRRLFQSQLNKAINSYTPETGTVVLMLLDLDNFKIINDTHGHQNGDALLKEAAKRLNGCTNGKGIAARLGGDEFTIVLEGITNKGEVSEVANKVLTELSRPFSIGIETFHVSASIGVTNFPADADNIDALIMNADQAMYKSKELGRNCYTYFSLDMRSAALNRMRAIDELRTAYDENQFEIFYQPIIDFETDQIVKAEALIRWNHPTRGLVGADDIIPLAEETGLIVEIGNWVFEDGIKQLAEWRTNYAPDFQLSINTSPVQYQHEECVVTDWYKIMDELDLPYEALVVEITENIMLDLDSSVSAKLEAFRAGGVQLALDDFGTGYSSLSYLKNLNSDYLKIDRSFVNNMVENNQHMALCFEIIKIAHIFGMKVIAEGVETQDQAWLLSDGGCDFGQGYFYAKPLAAKEFEALLIKQQHTLTKDSPSQLKLTADNL